MTIGTMLPPSYDDFLTIGTMKLTNFGDFMTTSTMLPPNYDDFLTIGTMLPPSYDDFLAIGTMLPRNYGDFLTIGTMWPPSYDNFLTIWFTVGVLFCCHCIIVQRDRQEECGCYMLAVAVCHRRNLTVQTFTYSSSFLQLSLSEVNILVKLVVAFIDPLLAVILLILTIYYSKNFTTLR